MILAAMDNGDSAGGLTAATGDVTLTPGTAERMAQTNIQPRATATSTLGSIGAGTVLALPDLVDTVGSSVGAWNRGAVFDSLGPDIRQFYDQHKVAAEVGSSVAGMLLIGAATDGIAAGAGFAGKSLRAIPGFEAITGLDMAAKRAAVAVRFGQQEIAARADFTMAQQLKGVVTVGGKETTMNALAGKAAWAFAKRNMVTGAAFEASAYTFMNTNDLLYPDSHPVSNSALAALGILVPGAMGAMVAARQQKIYATGVLGGLMAAKVDVTGLDRAATSFTFGKGTAGLATQEGTILTDSITRHALSADAKLAKADAITATEGGHGLPENLAGSASQSTKAAHDDLNQLLNRGVTGVEDSKIDPTKRPDVVRHAQRLIHDDPIALFNASHVSAIAEGEVPLAKATAIMDTFKEQGESLQASLKAARVKGDPEEIDKLGALVEINRLNQQSHVLIVRDGEALSIHDEAASLALYKPVIKYEASGNTHVWSDAAQGIGLNSNGEVFMKKKMPLEDLPTESIQSLYASGAKALAYLAEKAQPVMQLGKNPTWFKLDLAEELLKTAGDRARVIYPAGMTRETALVESLAQKLDILRAKGIKPTESMAMREQLNLPRLSTNERFLMQQDHHPLDVLLNGAKDGNDIRRLNIDEIRTTLSDYRKSTELMQHSADDTTTVGNSFSLGRDSKGNALEPFLMLKRPVEPEFYTAGNLTTRLADHQATVVTTMLSNGGNAPMLSALTKYIMTSPDYLKAIKVEELNPNQMQSTLPFMHGRISQTGLQTFDFAARDNPILLSTQRLQRWVDQFQRTHFDGLMKTVAAGGRAPMDVFADLRAAKNQSSSVLLDIFATARRGWDLTDNLIPHEKGSMFELSNTAENKAKWSQLFPGQYMPKGAVMPMGNGKPVVLDKLALEGLTSFQSLTSAAFHENNTLLRANGHGSMKQAPWYLPPRDMTGKHVRFVFSPDGNVAQAIVGETEEQVTKAVGRLLKEPKSLLNQPGYTIRSQTRLEEFNSLYNNAQTGLLNPNVPVVQVGAKRTGGALSPDIEFGAWESGLRNIQSQFNRLGKDATETIFRPQLLENKGRANLARGPVANDRSALRRTKEPVVIQDMYENSLLGRSPLLNERSAVARISNFVDTHANSVIQAIDSYIYRNVPFVGSSAAKQQFVELRDKLGDRMPFQDANDFVAQRFAMRVQPDVRKLAQSFNKLTASVVLRWGETAQALMNTSGMINTLPAVISQMTRHPGELDAAYRARVGDAAMFVAKGDGTSVGVLSMPKLIMKGVKDSWNVKAHPDYEYMMSQGYLSQAVAEYKNQLNSIEKMGTRYGEIAHQVDRVAGYLSDSSENFSRTYGHLVGENIARSVMGMTDRDAIHAWAHDFANKAIANYNPLNRPEVFQGGIGSMFGLFQSYMWNYYQRSYRYLETADMRSLALQYSMQATLYGTTSVPGWRQYNDLVNWGNDGKQNPYDTLYERFDPATADWIASGSVSNLPTLFGAPAMSIYTRGDANVRLPGTSPFPAAQMVLKTVNEAVGGGIDMFSKGHPDVTAQEVAEIFARASPSRPLYGLIDTFVAHATTDPKGNLISQETAMNMGTVYKLMGLRTNDEARQMENMYANQTQNAIRYSQQQDLLKASRSAIRGGHFDELPQMYAKYIELGGEPGGFKSWVRDMLITAVTPKANEAVLKALRDKDTINQAMRLLRQQDSSGDGEAPDGESSP